MSKLSLSIKLAAWSILILSSSHVAFWAFLSYLVSATGLNRGQFLPLFIFTCLISATGTLGLFVGVGILRAQSGARLAALVLGACVAVISLFGTIVTFFLLPEWTLGLFTGDLNLSNDSTRISLGCLYLLIFVVASWWIFLFSRKAVEIQFSATQTERKATGLKKPSCPPPVALLAWLMIVSGVLCAVSWPLILGKIPAMLFTHIFSAKPSIWIWITNIVLFIVCGIGLLKLQRWSYDGTIVFHAFWLVSPLVSQVSTNYAAYSHSCLKALDLDGIYPLLDRVHVSPWISATLTAIPTALLIAGLFYYRRSFLQAVYDSRRSGS